MNTALPAGPLPWTERFHPLLAPLLVVIMLVTNNPKVMGKRTNPTWLNVLGWTTTILMWLAAIAMFATWGK